MNKPALKSFALWARQRLLEQCHSLGDELAAEEEACSRFIRMITRRFLEVNSLPSQSCCCAQEPDEVTQRLISDIEEAQFKEVEIIGWLYQFYISEKHEKVVDPLHGKIISKEDIPAATQLFTTQWVVRYILDNSLGRYWLERNPGSCLGEKLTYLVTPKDGSFAQVYEPVSPQELKVLDPCVGAGHFLSYAFDLLLEIYRERGWTDGAAARSILENNLFGLDIDDRVVQLARFAVRAKAAVYDSDLLTAQVDLHIYAMGDSDQITEEFVVEFAGDNAPLTEELRRLGAAFDNAKEYGSMITAPKVNAAALQKRLRQLPQDHAPAQQLRALLNQTRILAGKYHIVVTNPPYMNRYSPRLKAYLNEHFAHCKGDLFSVFMFRSLGLCKEAGYCGLMTPMVWMFLKTYEQFREEILAQKSITTLIQFEYSAFEDATVPICAFVLKNASQQKKSLCFRLSAFPGDMQLQRKKVLEALANKNCGYFYEADQSRFSQIPGSPIAYWLSDRFMAAFENQTLDRIAKPRQGLATGCNEQFVRLWFEVADNRVCYDARSVTEAKETHKKWFPYNKGGEFRKWYGNNDYLVNWEQDGYLIRSFRNEQGQLRSRAQNTQFYFRESISWSLVSSGKVAFRYKPPGHIFDVAGMSCFAEEHLFYLLGLCNCLVTSEVLAVLAPTINFQAGDIANVPVVVEQTRLADVEQMVKDNIAISKCDWDAFETSWNFKKHPLV